MAKAASSPELKRAFERHLEETRRQVERLDQIGQELEMKLTGKKCKGMEGLIEEGKEIIEEDLDENALDAGLIGAAQKVEHYEIAGVRHGAHARRAARLHEGAPAAAADPERGRGDRQEADAAGREHHQRRSRRQPTDVRRSERMSRHSTERGQLPGRARSRYGIRRARRRG